MLRGRRQCTGNFQETYGMGSVWHVLVLLFSVYGCFYVITFGTDAQEALTRLTEVPECF